MSGDRPPVRIRVRYDERGGRVFCRVFVGRAWDNDKTLAKAGDLTFRDDEWDAVRGWLVIAGIPVIPEDAR